MDRNRLGNRGVARAEVWSCMKRDGRTSRTPTIRNNPRWRKKRGGRYSPRIDREGRRVLDGFGRFRGSLGREQGARELARVHRLAIGVCRGSLDVDREVPGPVLAIRPIHSDRDRQAPVCGFARAEPHLLEPRGAPLLHGRGAARHTQRAAAATRAAREITRQSSNGFAQIAP